MTNMLANIRLVSSLLCPTAFDIQDGQRAPVTRGPCPPPPPIFTSCPPIFTSCSLFRAITPPRRSNCTIIRLLQGPVLYLLRPAFVLYSRETGTSYTHYYMIIHIKTWVASGKGEFHSYEKGAQIRTRHFVNSAVEVRLRVRLTHLASSSP
jgi:hypothetical protein